MTHHLLNNLPLCTQITHPPRGAGHEVFKLLLRQRLSQIQKFQTLELLRVSEEQENQRNDSQIGEHGPPASHPQGPSSPGSGVQAGCKRRIRLRDLRGDTGGQKGPGRDLDQPPHSPGGKSKDNPAKVPE